MADKEIGQLTEALEVTGPDLFVLEQSGVAKKLLGSTLIRDLAAALDGHGGISGITYTPPVSGSVNGTLTIEYADGSDPFTATITNGVGISSVTSSTSGLETTYTFHYNDGGTYSFVVVDGVNIAGITSYYAVSTDNQSVPASWSAAMRTMTPINKYLWSYQEIALNNNETIDTLPTVIGVYGDTGPQTYVYFKWAQQRPTSSAEMSDLVGPWIGVCSTTSSSAPTDYTLYEWYEYKGAKGDTGTSIVNVSYVSTSGATDTYSVNLSDGTSTQFIVTNGSNIASIAKTGTSGLVDTYTVTLTTGSTTSFDVTNALSITGITRTSPTPPGPGTIDTYEISFNDAGMSYSFNVYNGINGEGSVSTVSGIGSDQNGDVPQVVLNNSAPTTSSEGYINQIWYDTLHNQLYVLVDNTGGVYQWRGASVTVDDAFNMLSMNPVQNAVITAKIGMGTLNTTATNLVGAINEVLGDIPSGSNTTPSADAPNGSAGLGTAWARSDHQHPLNVATSGTPANLGTAALGTAQTYARTDHVHNKPSVSDIGAMPDTGIMYFTAQTVSVATNGQIMRIPASGTNSNISANTVVLDCVFGAPENIKTDVSWVSYDGYISFSGTCSVATTASVILGKKGN